MWARALPFSLGKVQALRLDPTDELLCACAVGPDVDIVTGVQWLADAAVVMRSAGTEIDWFQFAERARARRVTARVGGTLKYLSAVANAPVPRDVVALLNGERLTGREQVAHWLYSRPVGPLGGLPGTLARHVRLTADLGVGAATRRLPRFLSDTWELDSVRQLPRAVSRKALATTRLHGAR
jgi:hypothetical protein